MANITFRGQQYRDDGAPLDEAGNVRAGGQWINPNYAFEGGILTDSSGTRFDAGSITSQGGMQIRPDVTAGIVPPRQAGTNLQNMPEQLGPAGNYSDPRMMSDFAAYFSDTPAGDTRNWGGGTLTRMANGSANYVYNGESQLIDANTDIASLAARSPELAAELARNYPGQSGMAGAAGGAAAGAMGGGNAGSMAQNLGLGAANNYGNPSQNPTLNGAESAIQRRMTENLNRNILPGIGQGMASVGGYGNSRHGVLEANSVRDMNLGLGDSLATMNSNDWNQQQGRNLSRYQGDQNFYSNERRTDLAQVGLGADLYSRGMNGEWDPIHNASQTYNPYTGLNSTTTNNQDSGGSNWERAIGGITTGATFGRQMGWW